ncbi:MAG: 50S ribosomal protein L9 [Planctomycetes bacterium]|nr:50S ribosomal protein L9 [Planctomycetota bacterium]
MEVLLRKEVEHLGHLGEVVEVAEGYARNYLLPKGIAVRVTSENLAEVERATEARKQREQEELERVNRQAELLEGFLCYVTARSTEQGHLFGSVGPREIVAKLEESGFEGIRPSSVSLPRSIEEVGDYEVEVMLHPDVRVNIMVRVAMETEAEKEDEE